MKLENGWVPVALSSSIEKGTSAGAVVEGVEVVVWRDNSGNAHVWEDRCPHRGMRMSFGFVRGDHIACLYHGWQYDTAGQCRYIPAHPDLDVPQTIKVPTYRTEERAGIVWATSSSDAKLSFAGAVEITPVRSLYADAALSDLLAAFGRHGLGPLDQQFGTISAEGEEMIVAFQSAGPLRSVAHIVVAGQAGNATLKQLALWAEALRLEVESPAFVAEVA